MKNVKFLLSILSCVLLMLQLHAQQPKEIGRAITTDGRRIILYENGTFRYELAETKWGPGTAVSPDTVQNLFPSPINKTSIQTSPYNTKEWRSTRTKFAIDYNPKKWKLKLRNVPPPDEAGLLMADTYTSILTERLETDYESWIQNLKLHYKELDPQAKLIKEEWRTVNGIPLYHMVWALNIRRMQIKLYGYYAIGKGEIMQMMVQTPLSVAGDTEEEAYRLLSGLKIYE